MSRRLDRILFLFLQIGMAILSLMLFSVLILSAMWRAPFLVLILSLGILVVFPVCLNKRKFLVARIILSGFILIMLVSFIAVPFKEIQRRMGNLKNKLEQHGHQSFTLEEKLGIYGSNIAMGIGGYVFRMPEAAKETLLLCVPGPEERRWTSDFAMRSRLVRGQLSKFVYHLKDLPSAKVEASMKEIRIAWHDYFADSRRVSLALNAFRLSAKAKREKNRWRIECSGWVPVRYPKRSWTHLFTIKSTRFYVEEGLFWALQQEGWLFPYNAVWSWTIYSDDRRLRQ